MSYGDAERVLKTFLFVTQRGATRDKKVCVYIFLIFI